MSFCKEVCPWAVRQSSQWSTWRGLIISAASVTAVFNPVMGLVMAKVAGLVIGAVDVVKNDEKQL